MATFRKVSNGYLALSAGGTDDTIFAATQALLQPNSAFNAGTGTDTLVLGSDGSTLSAAQNFVLPANILGLEIVNLAGSVKHNLDASKGAGKLTINGNITDNKIIGTNFNDVINADDGNDVITGGSGKGTDTLNGGDGNDVFIYNAGSELTFNEVVDGGDGNDDIGISRSAFGSDYDEVRFASTKAGDTLFLGPNVSGIDSVVIGTGNATAALPTVNSEASFLSFIDRGLNGKLTTAVTTGTANVNIDASLYQGSGLALQGNNGANRIIGTQNDDIIIGGGGADRLFGNDGDDAFVINSGAEYATNEVINGGDDDGDGDSIIVNTNGAIKFNSQTTEIENIISGYGLNGAAVATTIDASLVTSGEDGINFFGNSAINKVTGSSGEDSFHGFASNDVIDGGNDYDTLSLTEFSVLGESSYHRNEPIITTFTSANDAALKNVEAINVFGESAFSLNLSNQTESFDIYDNTFGDGTLTIRAGTGTEDTLYMYNSSNTFATDNSLSGVENIYFGESFGVDDSNGQTLDLSAQTEDFIIYNIGQNSTFKDSKGSDTYSGNASGVDNIIVNAATAADDYYDGGFNNNIIVSDESDLDNITVNISQNDDGGYLALHGEDIGLVNLDDDGEGYSFTINLSNLDGNSNTFSYDIGSNGFNSSYSVASETTDEDNELDTVNVQQIIKGSSGDNVIIANDDDNVIFGNDGNDTIVGNGGEDVIIAGEGADTIELGLYNFTSATVIQAAGDAQNYAFSNTEDDGILFNFDEFGVDLINGSSSFSFFGDYLNLALDISGLEHSDSYDTVTGDVSDNSFTTIFGTYENNQFTVDEDGSDTLVIYDDDTSSSVNSVAVVVTGNTSFDIYTVGASAILQP